MFDCIENHDRWRDHPDHRAAQRRGREDSSTTSPSIRPTAAQALSYVLRIVNASTVRGKRMAPGNPGDWRELEGQLTGEQIKTIEASVLDDELRLSWARELVESNLLQERFAHIPPPTECASEPQPWDDDGDGRYSRLFSVSSRLVIPGEDGLTGVVGVGGQQFSDGTVQRWVETSGPMIDAMTADQARDVADALLAAADELDRLNRNESL